VLFCVVVDTTMKSKQLNVDPFLDAVFNVHSSARGAMVAHMNWLVKS
jgi:hypothetical protein